MIDADTTPRDALLAEIEDGYDRLAAYLDTLDEVALSGPVDAAGWTAKDHVVHLAVWARSMIAVIEGKARWDAMGVDRVLWRTLADGYDAVNAEIQRQNRHLSAAETRRALATAHRALADRVATMSVAELSFPYHHYQPWATGQNEPLHAYLRGNTVEHYDEHRGYIEAIVGVGADGAPRAS